MALLDKAKNVVTSMQEDVKKQDAFMKEQKKIAEQNQKGGFGTISYDPVTKLYSYKSKSGKNDFSYSAAPPPPTSSDVVSSISGNADQFVGAQPDIVGDTYFDMLLDEIENDTKQKTKVAKGQYDLFVSHLKQERALFQEDLAKDYARALQKQNEQAYTRGFGDSGARIETFDRTKEDRDFSEKSKDLELLQKQDVSREAYEQRLQDIQKEASRMRSSLKSPYAQFQYK